MDDGDGNGIGCSEVEVRTDATKLMNVIITGFRERDEILSENERCLSKMKPRLRACGAK